MSRSRILFQLTGSISAYKACSAISLLVKAGHEVRCVATPSALKFVGEATLEGLSGFPVLSDGFEKGRMMDHIALARWADTAVLCPATARTINGLASGAATGIVGDLYLAWDERKPYFVFPAMNSMMLLHSSTQDSISRLKRRGVLVQDTNSGDLACGETGVGRLLEPDEIFRLIVKPSADFKSGPSVLITYGGTVEPIDPIRSITNTSTGQTGSFIAEEMSLMGFDVTVVCSESADVPRGVSCHRFKTFSDLDRTLKGLLSSNRFDSVVHLAAVSDYSVAEPATEKISSDREELNIRLKRNFKIVDRLKSYSKNDLQVIAFKLTAGSVDPSNDVRKLGSGGNVDYVVHNELSEITQENHPFQLYEVSDDEPRRLIKGNSKSDLARALVRLCQSSRKLVDKSAGRTASQSQSIETSRRDQEADNAPYA